MKELSPMTVFLIAFLLVGCIGFYKNAQYHKSEFHRYYTEIHQRMEKCPEGLAILKQYDEERQEEYETTMVNYR